MIRSKHLSAAAAILALALSVFAQSTPIRVDGNVIKSYISILADEAHQGRKTLSHGHEMSVQWAADLFKKWGVQPAATFPSSRPLVGQEVSTNPSPKRATDSVARQGRNQSKNHETHEIREMSIRVIRVFRGHILGWVPRVRIRLETVRRII